MSVSSSRCWGRQLFERGKEAVGAALGVRVRCRHEGDEIAGAKLADALLEHLRDRHGGCGFALQACPNGLDDIERALGRTRAALDLARRDGLLKPRHDQLARGARRCFAFQDPFEVIHHPLTRLGVVFAGRHRQQRGQDPEVEGVVLLKPREGQEGGLAQPPVGVLRPWHDERQARLDVLRRGELQRHQRAVDHPPRLGGIR